MKNCIRTILKKSNRPLSFDEIIKNIGIKRPMYASMSTDQIEEIRDMLDSGCNNHEYYKTVNGNYTLFKENLMIGKFRAYKDGKNGIFQTTRNYAIGEKNVSEIIEYKVSGANNPFAINGDVVLAELFNNSTDVRILEVLDRNTKTIPGTVFKDGDMYYLKPVDSKKSNISICLGSSIDPNISDETIVSVSLDKKTGPNDYYGKIDRIFNYSDCSGKDILFAAFKSGINIGFSDASLKQLDDIPNYVRDIDKIGREDLTGEEIFTIDGIDTKDMDDAIGLKINSKGNYELNVSIVDIASIVPEDSPLDKDAFSKCNSYYLGGIVIPMFPYKISKGIGSLNENEERLSISVIMEFTPEGKRVGYRIVPSVIKSRKKMTYEKVNNILKNGDIDPEYEPYAKSLYNMNKLAHALRNKRNKNGSILFLRDEPRLKYDDDGNVIGFDIKHQDEAENLIAEFMIAANECVDTELSRRGLPCVHRVHDHPKERKIEELLNLLNAINLPYDTYSPEELATRRSAFKDFVGHIPRKGNLSNFLMMKAISCMSRAKYSRENIGHFGLSINNYCHFTSPVRRYPDLTIQRLLWDYVFNRKSIKDSNGIQRLNDRIDKICTNSSQLERVANSCQEYVLRMQTAGYMENKIGMEFSASIIDISSRGLTVLLDDYLVEGFINTSSLGGRYCFSPDSYSLVSLDNSMDYYIGDILKVKVKSASKSEYKIEFEVVEKIKENRTRNADVINNSVKKIKNK